MTIRAHKWATGVLVCAVLILGWRAFTQYRQMLAASFIAFQCEDTERFATGATDPEALASDVEFLTACYDGERKKLLRSPLGYVVRREYEHSLTNALVAFRRITTNDLGDDLSAWLQKYGRHLPPAQRSD